MAGKKKGNKVLYRYDCMECEAKFTTWMGPNTHEVECTKCGSTDVFPIGETTKEIKVKPERKVWFGSKPEKCDICHKPFNGEFIDGRTQSGPWGMLCPPCHKTYGVGLGTGNGQHYKLAEDGKFEKVAG